MKDLVTLGNEKGQLVAEYRSVIDAAELRGGLNDEDKAKLQKMDDAIDLNERSIKLAQAEEEVRRTAAQSDHGQRVGATVANDQELRNEAFGYFLRGGVNAVPAELREMLQRDTENRAQTTGTGTSGGYLIPRGFSNELDIALKSFGGVLSVGRMYNTSSGNLIEWPTFDDTANSGVLIAESADATSVGADMVFGQKTLSAYNYTTGVCLIPNQLIEDSAFPIQSMLVEAFATRLNRRMNTALTTGTGSSQPQGIVTGSAAGVTAAATAALTFDEVIDLYHSVDPAYRPNAGFMFNDSTIKAVRKLKDSEGRYLWQMGDVRTGVPDTLLGKTYTINQDMDSLAAAKKVMLFGDFSRFVIRQVGQPVAMRLVERYAEFNQVGFVTNMRLDGRVLNSGAIKHLITAAS